MRKNFEFVIPGEKREVKMESMAWFHGKISRDKAEELLIGNGVRFFARGFRQNHYGVVVVGYGDGGPGVGKGGDNLGCNDVYVDFVERGVLGCSGSDGGNGDGNSWVTG